MMVNKANREFDLLVEGGQTDRQMSTGDNSMRDEYYEGWPWVWFYPEMQRMNYPSST